MIYFLSFVQNKNLGKKFLEKKFWKQIFGLKKFYGRKNFRVKKIFGIKKNWVNKIFGHKISLG